MLTLWSVLVPPALLAAWIAALVTTRVPLGLHRFLRAYVGYAASVSGWLSLVTRRYPSAWRTRGVRLDAERERHARWRILLRPLLALPAALLASVFAVVLAVSALGAWFVALGRGRTTGGLRELGAFCIRYHVELLAYLLLVGPCAPQLAPPRTNRRPR